MKRALVISSQLAVSSVGAKNTAFCLRRLGVETAVLPTTLMGRHPGWGDPGGQVTDTHILKEMWQGVSAQEYQFDAVVTGYMGSVQNVELSADIIGSIKQQNPDTIILVDPVMGDHGKLYIAESVAQAILSNLVNIADIITPNVWEFSYMLSQALPDMKAIQSALLDYGGKALITSVRHHGRIGALSYHSDGLTFIGHEEFEKIPHGGGDALAGCLAAHLLNGRTDSEAARRAVSSIFSIMQRAVQEGRRELPLIAHQRLLLDAPLLSQSKIK